MRCQTQGVKVESVMVNGGDGRGFRGGRAGGRAAAAAAGGKRGATGV